MATSMTGIGSAEVQYGNATIFAEIKSLNNRYLEVSCRMSALLSSYEKDIRDLVREFIQRGKLVVTVTIQGETEGALGLKVDAQTVQAIRSLLLDVRKKAGIREPLKMDHFLKFSEIFQTRGETTELEQTWIEIRNALVQALKNLKSMRDQEGQILSDDITSRVRGLENHLNAIEKMSKASIPENFQRMVERIRKLTQDTDVDSDRLNTELALLADKLDVTEECVRLHCHHKLFFEILEKEKTVGKKLTFLLQEMNREVNTISAKSNHGEISHLVVLMKEEIEKLREQVQNLE